MAELIQLSASYSINNLELLLQNKAIVPVYRLFCCSLRLEDYVDLYLDIREFRSIYSTESNSIPSKPIEKAARELYDKFFGAESLAEISVPSNILEQTLTSIETKCDEDVFKELLRAVVQTLKEKTLVPFTETNAYHNFLKGHKSIYIRRDKKQTNTKDEIEQEFKRIRDSQTHLSNIYGNISKKLESNNVAVKNGQVLASLLSQYGESIPSSESEDISNLVASLKTASETMKSLEELQFNMNRLMVKKFETPLNNILKSEIVVAQNQKKKYDKKPKDSPTIQETLVTLKDCNHKSDLQTVKSMCDLMELYLEVYENGHKIMRKMLPTIMNLRTIVEIEELRREGGQFEIGSKLDVPEVEIIKQGQLDKKGGKRRNWTTRWFVLKSKYLFYFNNNIEKELKGAIFLQNCTVEPSANKKKNQWIFEINTSIRTYFISASSEQEMKNWIQAIRNATAESESKKIVDQQKKQLNLIVENQVDNYIQSSLSDRKNEPQHDLQNNNESSSASTTEIKSTSDPVVQTSGLTTADLLNQLLASENQEKEKSVEIKEVKEVKESPSSPSHSPSPLPSPTPSPPSPLKSEVEVEVKEEIVVEEKKDEQSLNDTNKTVVSETPKKEKRETRRALKKNDDDDDDDEDVDDDSDDYVDDDDDDDDDESFESDEEEISKLLHQSAENNESASTVEGENNHNAGNKSEEQDDQLVEHKQETDDHKQETDDQLNNDDSNKGRSDTNLLAEKIAQENLDLEDVSKFQAKTSNDKDKANTSLSSSSSGRGPNVLFKQGYLSKKGAKRRNWTTRWFILKYNSLAYYKNPGDREPKGTICLKGCIVEPSDKRPYCFAIVGKDRTYFIHAKNSVMQEEWMTAIKSCIQN